MLIASLLHDVGLWEGASEGGAYVTDGRRYAERILRGPQGWEDPRRLPMTMPLIFIRGSAR